MKTLAAITLALALPLLSLAQSPAEKLLKKYEGEHGIDVAQISDNMFRTFLRLADDETEAEVLELVSGLSGVVLVSVDTVAAPETAQTFYANTHASLTEKAYMTMMTVDSEVSEIKLLIWGENGKISELVLLGDRFMAILVGDIQLDQIVALSESIYIEGLDVDGN